MSFSRHGSQHSFFAIQPWWFHRTIGPANLSSRVAPLNLICSWDSPGSENCTIGTYLAQATSKGAHDDVEWPLVLDADDIIAEPAFVVQYGQIVGIDTSRLRFEWTPAASAEKEQMGPLVGRLLSCLMNSSGVQKDKSSTNLDPVDEAAKWKGEFGDEVGE